jgi:hypothetical protein
MRTDDGRVAASVYVDLAGGGVADLSEEIPYEKPTVLFPAAGEYVVAGEAAVCSSVFISGIRELQRLKKGSVQHGATSAAVCAAPNAGC